MSVNERRNRAAPGRFSRRRRRCARGFTLIETIMVIALLGMVSATLLSMQPQVFRAQTNARDQYVGLEQMRACAERILSVRRTSGFASVTTALCNGLGGQGNYALNPTVTLTVDSSPTAVTTCSTGTVTCTATVSIAKTSGPAATLAPLTVQISVY
jgi:prepilin-type N-terminal cleavage/methylation domain-containing protein